MDVMVYCKRLLWILVLTGVWHAAASAEASATPVPTAECVALANTLIGRAHSTSIALQLHLSTGETTKGMVNGVLSDQGWQEGNPYWEKVYDIFYPRVYQYMSDTLARLGVLQKSELAKRLSPDLCSGYGKLLRTKHGLVSQRINEILAMERQFDAHSNNANLGKQGRIWLGKMRHELADEKSRIFNEQDFVRNQGPYRKAYTEIIEYEKNVVKVASQSEEVIAAFSAAQSDSARKFGQELAASRLKEISAVVQAFRDQAKR